MMKQILPYPLFFVSLLILLGGFPQNGMMAQRAYKPVKIALKAKNYAEAIVQINKLKKDSVYKDDVKLYAYAIEANSGLNDLENTKIYLKKDYDTLAFFSTTYITIREAMTLDSLERIETSGQKESKYGRLVGETLSRFFPNINAGGRYFYRKKDYVEAMKFFRMSLDLPVRYSERYNDIHLPPQTASLNACYYLFSAFSAGLYAEVPRYVDLALKHAPVQSSIMECMVLTAEAQKDTANYLAWLDRGWRSFPKNEMFFSRLVDFYLSEKNYKMVLDIAVRQEQTDSADVKSLRAQCLSLYKLGMYDEAIIKGKKVLSMSADDADALYCVGAAYVSLAQKVELPDNINSQNYKKMIQTRKSYLSQAEPFLARFRELFPQKQGVWAPLLYHVYLDLNNGTKFAEIEKILSNLN